MRTVLVILLALHVLSRPVLFGNGKNQGNKPKKIATIQIEGAGDTSSGNGLPLGRSSVQDTNGSMVQYYDGPLIQNISVILVLVQKVTNTTITQKGKTTYKVTVTPVNYANQLPAFYQTLVAPGPYMNFLSTFSAGNYIIGPGTFIGTLPYNWTTNVNTLTDANIQSEIDLNILPAAITKFGNFNTTNVYFAMHWANGFTINMSGVNCVQWCAYHGTTMASIAYGVIPDFGGTNACNNGCNCYYSGYCNHSNRLDYFSSTTVVASHEFAETITDRDVDLAWYWGPPLGWADNKTGAEIGDNCNQLPALLENKYWTQRLASNINNACYPLPSGNLAWAIWS